MRQDAFTIAAQPVSQMDVGVRAAFITKTYTHLFAAIAAFTAIEIALFKADVAEAIAAPLLHQPFIVFGGFMLVSWLASRTAHRVKSLPVQYLALGAYVIAWAFMFVPILYLADSYAGSAETAVGGGGVIASAAIMTLGGFAGLTIIAFVTRKDFSFLRSFLIWIFVGAILAIFGGVFFGFNLGMWFSVAMVVFAGAAILYDTSNIIHHFPEDRYVGAALELFGSVAMMFFYILRIFMSRD